MAHDVTVATLDGGTTTDYRKLKVDSNGKLLVSATVSSGGPTEYTEGATDTTITGIAAMTEGPSDTITPLQTDASKNLKVAVQGTVAVSSTTLATETTLLDVLGAVDQLEGFTDGIEGALTTGNTNTGNAATSLAIIDDWDESDRAKVNPIVGQAGVQGGAGAVSANTQRVVIATDQTSIPITSSGADPAATFYHGSKSSIGTSEVQMFAAGQAVTKGVTVKAAVANTGIVYVGKTGVTAGTTDATDGFELQNGESCFVQVDNVNDIFLIASAASQKVFWIGV